jgi:transposase
MALLFGKSFVLHNLPYFTLFPLFCFRGEIHASFFLFRFRLSNDFVSASIIILALRPKTYENILALHSKGITAAKISELANASKRTVYHVLYTYQNGGLEAVYLYDKCKHPSELEKFADVIINDLTQRPAASLAEICSRIEKLTGLKRSRGRVAAFLKKRE